MTGKPVLYTGLDAAWGGRLPGGICTLDGGPAPTLRSPPVRMHWDELVDQVTGWEDSPRIVAIDQPLVVVNDRGARHVERLIARRFMSRFRCGAYPANLSNIRCFGPDAGIWRLVAALHGCGFTYDPKRVLGGGAGRWFIEAYPHTALLGIFELDRVPRYKVHKKEPDEWCRLLHLVRGLQQSPHLPLRDEFGFLAQDLCQNKENEDLIDALICAYTAAWVHRLGAARSFILGDAETGAIVSPASPAMREVFRAEDPVDVVPLGPHPVPIPQTPSEPAPETEKQPVRRTSVRSLATAKTPPPQSKLGVRYRAKLWASDTGNLWRNVAGEPLNDWLDRFTRVRLTVCFVDLDGEPQVYFQPFRRDGEEQKGMRPAPGEENMGLWEFISDGCSKKQPKPYDVRYRFAPE